MLDHRSASLRPKGDPGERGPRTLVLMSDDGWLLAGPSAPEEVQRYYDALAPEYDTTLDEWGYTAPATATAMMLGLLAERGAGTEQLELLDAGCGTGLVGATARSAGFAGRITGLDLSPASIERATGRGVYDQLGVADLQQPLPLGDDAVDGVLCVGVLTYLPDVTSVWREFCRVTRPGGVVVFTQRDDVWVERHCAAVVDQLERQRRWKLLHVGVPEPYLPGNADFADRVLARLVAARVR